MSLPWWGWVAFVVMIWVGLALLVAPVIGRMLADQVQPSHCSACRRELIGDPPEHRVEDRANCAAVIVIQTAARQQRRFPLDPWRPR